MAELLPQAFSGMQEPSIASYSFSDIAAKAGYVSYYGGQMGVSGSTIFNLSNNSFYSDVVTVAYHSASATYEKTHDLDFDILFAAPQTIKGDVIAVIPVGRYDSVSMITAMYPIVRVRKWDGTTETEIANGVGIVWTSDNVANLVSDLFNVKVTVPRTHYKKGETLRITVEMYGKINSGGGANQQFLVGVDPKGRIKSYKQGSSLWFNSGDLTTISFQVPYVIDI